MVKKIPYINLIKQSQDEKKEIFQSLNKIFLKGEFILGDEVDLFEKRICKYLGVKHCVALNSGTDALVIGLHLLGVKRGDEVITPPNSFVASTAAIVHLGAIPIFADVKEDQNIDPEEIEKKITKKTKAIMPVHLSGRSCEMSRIKYISKKFKIPIIEDAAQSIGTKFNGKFVGTFGDVGCFSAHPLKNLNAIGDAGYLVTNSSKIANLTKLLRNHGIRKRNEILSFGYVSRMDNLQATVLNLRLKKLSQVIRKRRLNAKLYFENLKNIKNLKLPNEKKDEFNTYHTFVIRVKNRDKLKKYLEKKRISTAIHYPYLIFEQKAYKKKFKKTKNNDFKVAKELKNKILTLPINQFMSSKEIIRVCKEIKKFYKCF
jgi:dTDP-4-amino-4,6-dideoxygalactose transaminase